MPQPEKPKQTKAVEKEEEKRIDRSDGRPYTKKEFISEYGGTRNWDSSKIYKPQPKKVEAPVKKVEPIEEKKAAVVSVFNASKTGKSWGDFDLNSMAKKEN